MAGRGPDAHRLIERALAASAEAAGCTLVSLDGRSERWASVTFTGARHGWTLFLEDGEPARTWVASLAEMDFTLPGHVVADCTVTASTRDGERRRVAIEALSVECA